MDRTGLGDVQTLHFAVWLSARGGAAPKVVLQAVERCLSRTPLFGQVALRERRLSVAQVVKILQRQAISQERFGEIAVALGYLTPEGVADVLRRQQAAAPTLLEALQELRDDEGATLQSARADFEEYLRVVSRPVDAPYGEPLSIH